LSAAHEDEVPQRERAMQRFTSAPDRAYDYVYSNYGTVGLIVCGVAVVVAVVSLLIWYDRTR
jgi:hypothetical protein